MNANLTEMEAALRRFERETPHSPAECALADALVCVLAELTDLYRVRECQREWEQGQNNFRKKSADPLQSRKTVL